MKFSCQRKFYAIIFASLLMLASVPPANSSENMADQWQFQLAAYGWLSGQHGSVAPISGLPAVDIDIDFWDDIAGNINGALYLIGEARKESFGVVMDVVYSDIEFEKTTPGSLYSSIFSQTETWMVTTAGFYRLAEASTGFVDILAGVRYWAIESTLGLTSGVLARRNISNKEEWLDPLVGFKGMYALGQSNFFLSGVFLLGGFGAGSDLLFDGNLNLGYNWTKTFSTTIGYRYMDVDYDKDGYLYDVYQDGPTMSLSWRF